MVDFLHQHPELSLSVELTDRSVDLIEEGYDLAIRTGPTDARGPRRLAADAAQLRAVRRTRLPCPSRRARHAWRSGPHHCITNSQNPRCVWRFNGPDGDTEVPIHGRLQVNNAMLRCDAARAGAGVLLCADYLVEDDIANGTPGAAVAGPCAGRREHCMR